MPIHLIQQYYLLLYCGIDYKHNYIHMLCYQIIYSFYFGPVNIFWEV